MILLLLLLPFLLAAAILLYFMMRNYVLNGIMRTIRKNLEGVGAIAKKKNNNKQNENKSGLAHI